MPNERCVRDDVTDCDCDGCVAADEAFWAGQQVAEMCDAHDHDFGDEEPTVRVPRITMAELMGVG